MHPPRMLFVLVTVAAFGAWLVALFRDVSVGVTDAYAVEWVSGIVIDFMEANQGRWPTCSDDLRAPYQAATRQYTCPCSFEELQARVQVDWDADPSELVTANTDGQSPPFKVIWLSAGRDDHVVLEPNQRVRDYLNRKATETRQRENGR